MSTWTRDGIKIQAWAVNGGEREYRSAPDEATGMVWCPMKKTGIAVMKCWEYQQRLGCGRRCPNAVTKEQVDELRASMRVGEHNGLHTTCILCGREKRLTRSMHCLSCSNRIEKKRRKYAACLRCKEPKPATTRRLCPSCAQTLRQRAIKREQKKALHG